MKHNIFTLRLSAFAVLCFLAACDGVDLDPPTATAGGSEPTGALGVDARLMGSWIQVTMELDGGEPISMRLSEALKIERAAENEDGSYRWPYRIVIEELEIEALELRRAQTVRVGGRQRRDVLWKSAFEDAGENRFALTRDGGLDEFFEVLSVGEEFITLRLSLGGEAIFSSGTHAFEKLTPGAFPAPAI